jgi:hypothetical protein
VGAHRVDRVDQLSDQVFFPPRTSSSSRYWRHLKEGQFVTKFRKTFIKAEMDEDLVIVPAKLGSAEDRSEYEEILPTSPP